MTDWGAEPPLDLEEDIRGMDFIPGDWYWVLHSNPAFTGDVGILRFTNGKAAFAPDYIFGRGKANWYQDDGLGGYTQVGMVSAQGENLLWILAWCWAKNGFTITPMNGGQAEYDEIIPTEGIVAELPGGGEEVVSPMETGEGAGESGEEEVSTDG